MSLPSQPIFRFAPSPNGWLHLGHAYSALYTDHWARAMGGVALLRIEDIDRARCRPEFAAGIFEDLQWLGLAYREPVLVQSTRFGAYGIAAGRLKTMGLLYPCFCSRTDIRAASDGRADPDGAPLYPGTCRGLSDAEREHRLASGTPAQWRLDMSQAIDLFEDFSILEAMPTPDRKAIARPADPARWGDVVIVRKDTPTSYHLAVALDDAMQGVTHVTRGMDLYAATDIHVVLQRLLGLSSPIYTHHGVIGDEHGEKLSKSRGSQSLAALRAAGVDPERLRQELGF